jgi:hypothetical protein
MPEGGSCSDCNPQTQYCEGYTVVGNGPGGDQSGLACTNIPDSCLDNVTCGCVQKATDETGGGFNCTELDGGVLFLGSQT